jgi:signal transduction histidine kinase/ActR/RegA family two-component response regulator
MTSVGSVGSQGSDALASLRERVLRGALTTLAIGVPVISVVIIVGGLRTHHNDPMTLGLSLYTLSFPVLRLLCGRLRTRTSALALISLLALTGFLVEIRGGVGAGNMLVNAMVLTLSALFFGRRGATVSLVVTGGLLALAGALVLHGSVPPLTKSMWDAATPTFWTRAVIAYFLVGLAVTVTQVYVVERLAHEATRLEAFAANEHQQRVALERAQLEREQEREHRLRTQKALEESRRIEALARMAGGIAHDFNNSLTVIMGAAEAMDHATSVHEAREYSHEILEAARHTAELTRQLLTLGRRQVSQPQAVAMPALWKRLHSAFRRLLPEDIALDMPEPPAEAVAQVDPGELERALLNLVLNARDAMPRGGRLRVECGCKANDRHPPEADGGRQIEIVVADTGEGIAPEALERIFEPFFTTKAVGAGTGLGLATVYAFAKAAGGDLRVSSLPGAGATFTLVLPTATTSMEAPSAARPSEPPEAPLPETHVLVVEDNAAVREHMVRVLGANGFQVTQAADGDQAIARLAERDDFAVMCIDGVTPGATAQEVIARAERQSSPVRVLLCSGYLREDLLRRGVATGRYAFLAKPFAAHDLVARVRGLARAATARSDP